MLPVAICDSDRSMCARWMDLLDEIARRDFPDIRLEMTPCGQSQLKRMLDETQGIMLVILTARTAVNSVQWDFGQMAVQVMERNRDNYLLLCVQVFTQINDILSKCVRPAGILVLPVDEAYMEALIKRILSDYQMINGGSDNTQYIVLETGRGVQRVAYRDILYIESQGKLINICINRYVISVRRTLEGILQQLPSDFIRCHRSYVVNRNYIEKTDMVEMTLTLKNGEQLPISRSYKETVRNAVSEVGFK